MHGQRHPAAKCPLTCHSGGGRLRTGLHRRCWQGAMRAGWDAGDHGNVTGDVTGPFGALGTSVPIWATRYNEPETRIAAVEGGRPENRNGCLRDSRLRPRGLRPPVGPGSKASG